MTFLDNTVVLQAYATCDEDRHVSDLVKLTLVGENYKIKTIRYLVKDVTQPLEDFICFEEYDDDFLLIQCHTREEELLAVMANEIESSVFGEKEIRTPYSDILTVPMLTSRFHMTVSGEDVSPIYALIDHRQLSPLALPCGVTVELWDGSDAESVISAMTDIGEDVVWVCECYRDTRRYLLRKEGSPVGVLRAECAYKNYYDIGWLHIEPAYRGQGLGTCLTLAFAHDCLARGDRPHFGFAISEESARVAEKCGFVNVRESVMAVKVQKLIC